MFGLAVHPMEALPVAAAIHENGITFQHRCVRCGKASCCPRGEAGRHGPYWYAYWCYRGKTYTAYIGKERSDDAIQAHLANYKWQQLVYEYLLDMEAKAAKRRQEQPQEELRRKEEEQRRLWEEAYKRARQERLWEQLRQASYAEDFATLGVSVAASWDEVQRAYRSAALRHHPDRGGSHEVMVAINQAFDRLQHCYGWA